MKSEDNGGMAMKLWSGRFSGGTDSRMDDFNSSIAFDARMARQDIQGSVAHATMLGQTGILSREESDLIVGCLLGIAADLESGKLLIDPKAEDIHTFVEAVLTQRLGDLGKKLHTARSRNDQVALDIRLTLKEDVDGIVLRLKGLCTAFCTIAGQHTLTIMPGYTHLQRAQPVTFGHHMMAYAQMVLRDIDRLTDARRRMDCMPLGSGALAGTTFPINRELTAELLGFSGVTQNSLDGVSDRDFCLELASALSILMVHLSRLSEELILWCSWEFGFIELSDAFTTGSSIMPQKKNPDVAELIRGKTARVFGDLMTLLSMMKSLPLAYNKDMQEDKEAIFDAVDTVSMCLSTLTPMLLSMKVKPDTMLDATKKGFLNATDCADYLVGKGLPFRDAYKITGSLVRLCLERGDTLDSLPMEEYKHFSELFSQDVYEAIDLMRCVTGRNVTGGPAPEAVKRQIEGVRKQLAML
jgi:argininosuccinate lyase